MKLGYHISSEEHPTQTLIDLARKAEEAGFSFAFVSDHFHPWVDAQGQSPFVWTTIGGISQVTKKIKIITAVTCPIIRIHPVIIAQAAATSAQVLNGRFVLGLGTGENLNEHIVGQGWPKIQIRQEMLLEAIKIIKLLWQGGYQNYFGKYFTVEDARIYSLPEKPPPIFIGASGPKSAGIAGEVSDGLISTSQNPEVIQAFNERGGKQKPKYAQIAVCYDKDEERAKKIAFEMWPSKGISGSLHQDLATPRHFEAAAKPLRIEDVVTNIAVGPDKQKHIEMIKKYFDAGFDYVGVSQIGPNQDEFFEFYEKEILPEFK